MWPLALFMHTDSVGKTGVVCSSFRSISTSATRFRDPRCIPTRTRLEAALGKEFLYTEDMDEFFNAHGKEDVPSAKVFAAGMAEWRRTTVGTVVDKEGTRSRLAVAMHSAVSAEVDRLAERLNILATIGSVAPFVGLFGTVWGIMRSFSDIAGANNTSLAVVAPGIAEALFATAIGLFAAIPAVIAYNRMSYGINRVEARLSRFADSFHGALSRELEREL